MRCLISCLVAVAFGGEALPEPPVIKPAEAYADDIARAADGISAWRSTTPYVAGWRVNSVPLGGMPEQQGLEPDDLIISVDGRPPPAVKNPDIPAAGAVFEVIRRFGDGSPQPVTILAQDQPHTGWLRAAVLWDAGHRLAGGAATAQVQVAVRLLELDRPAAAAAVLAQARAAGADGPWLRAVQAITCLALCRYDESATLAQHAAQSLPPIPAAEMRLLAGRALLLSLRYRDYAALLAAHPDIASWDLPAALPDDLIADAEAALQMPAWDATTPSTDLLAERRVTTDGKGKELLDLLFAKRSLQWITAPVKNYQVVRLDTQALDAVWRNDLEVTHESRRGENWARHAIFTVRDASQDKGDPWCDITWRPVYRQIALSSRGVFQVPITIPWAWGGTGTRRFAVEVQGPRIRVLIDDQVVALAARPRSSTAKVGFAWWNEGCSSWIARAELFDRTPAGAMPPPPATPSGGSADF